MKQKMIVRMITILMTLAFFTGCAADSQKEDVAQEMVFSLRTNYSEFFDDELSTLLFEEIIGSFEPDIWDFMVLAPEKPINNCTFIQVGAPDEIVDYHYTLEIGFDSDESGLTMYRLNTLDRDFVLQCFVDYWQDQLIPDVSSWEDITEEVLLP